MRLKNGISPLLYAPIYTTHSHTQYDAVIRVEVHGVLPSNCGISAFERDNQFHQDTVGDSGEVVTPFMRVTN